MQACTINTCHDDSQTHHTDTHCRSRMTSVSVHAGTLSLTGCTLDGSFAGQNGFETDGVVSLSFDSMAVPLGLIGTAQLIDEGSSLHLVDVTTMEAAAVVGALLTGTMVIGVDGWTIEPRNWGISGSPAFIVVSGDYCTNGAVGGCDGCDNYVTLAGDQRGEGSYAGTPPCVISDGGRCVGRPNGYVSDERCTITVGGGGGVIGGCSVFDLDSGGGDYITLPGPVLSTDVGVNGWHPTLNRHYVADCPVGASLAPGDTIEWRADYVTQGSASQGRSSSYDVGGGWQLCFEGTNARDDSPAAADIPFTYTQHSHCGQNA